MVQNDNHMGELVTVVKSIVDGSDSDILLINAPLHRHLCSAIIDRCIQRGKAGKQHKNLLLILVTIGGDADVAYRIARCLQQRYENVSVYISGYCKSAGTLLALSGHQLIFSDHGEMGPIDVQMRKENSLFDHQSGLTVNASLANLQDRAFQAFEEYFLHIENASLGAITVETAGKIASDLSTGLYTGLMGRIDPLHVGEAARAMRIAVQYGTALIQSSRNASPDALERLVGAYPSHSYVIDRKEAQDIFMNVREPNMLESQLAHLLQPMSRYPRSSEENESSGTFNFVNDSVQDYIDTQTDTDTPDTKPATEMESNDKTGQKISVRQPTDSRHANVPDIETTAGNVSPAGANTDAAKVARIKDA